MYVCMLQNSYYSRTKASFPFLTRFLLNNFLFIKLFTENKMTIISNATHQSVHNNIIKNEPNKFAVVSAI